MTRGRRRLLAPWRRSLRARLVTSFLVLSVMTVAVVGTAVYLRATADLERAVLDRLAAAADLKSEAVNRWVDEQRRNVVFASGLLRDVSPETGDDIVRTLLADGGDVADREAARTRVVGVLDHVVRETADAQELLVLGLDGVVRASTFEEHDGASQATEAYFVRGGSATWVEGVFTSELTRGPTIAVATPVFATDGQRVGVLAALLDLRRLDRILLDRAGLGATGQTYLVEADGRLLQGGASGASASSAGIDAALSGSDGSDLYSSHLGVPVAGAYRWLPAIGVALMAEMTQDEAFAPAREMAWLVALIGLAAVTLLAVAIWAIARSATEPILVLAETAKRVAQGDLDATAPVTSEDEVGSLTTAFNQMTAQLRENVATLERRVTERTAELQQRNAELAIVNEVAGALAKQLDFQAIIEAVGDRAADALAATGLSIAMREEASGVIRFLYWVDEGSRSRELEGTELKDILTVRILETGSAIRIGSSDEAEAIGAPFKIGGTESYLGVPIPIGDRSMGVIAIGSRQRDAYSEDDERLLSTLATNMGVALSNARLFAELNAAMKAQGEAEARYRKLVEELPIALYIDRPDERAASEYVSPMIVPMFGYPAEAWESDAFFPTVIHPDDRDRVLQDHIEVFAEGRDRWSWDFRIIAADGRTVWVHDEAVVVKDEDGKAAYVQGFIQDVTEEREAAAEVRRQKSYFEALVDASPVAIVVMDREEQVTAWNPAAERLFGYDADEAVGRHIDGLIFSEDRRAEGKVTTTEARDRGRSQRIGQRTRRDGRMVDVEIVVVPLRIDGEHVGYYAIYHDITELSDARKAAETANQAKSAFLAAMSHEIRTPMNAIIGMSGLLVDTPMRDDQREYAETIRTSGEALLTIINDILDFSKIEAGRVDLEAQPFAPHRVIEGAMDVLAPTAAKKGITLAYEPGPSLPPALVGDAGRLRQILLNLLSNAVKFTEMGEVVLAVDGRALDDGRHELEVTVRDTGIGIPPDRIGDLFQSFSQVDASISRRFGGTGLGLAISRRLAERMDGSLVASSSGIPGEGATFRLVIRAPLAPEESVPATARRTAAGADAAGDARPGETHPLRILLAEDNAMNRRLALILLERIGYAADVVENGREVIEAIDRATYDVVLMDIQMPEVDGLEATRRIRARWPDGARPRIVALTANAMHEDREATVEAGMDDYLSKPIRPAELTDALRRSPRRTDA